MTFKEYSDEAGTLMSIIQDTKADIVSSIDYYVTLRVEVTENIILHSFDLAWRFYVELKDADLRARIEKLESPTEGPSVYEILLGILVPSIVGRGLGALARHSILRLEGRGAKFLKGLDRAIKKLTLSRSGETKVGQAGELIEVRKALNDFSSKQIVQDLGKGLAKSVYKSILETRDVKINAPADNVPVSSSLINRASAKNEIAPSRGFLETLNRSLKRPNQEWSKLAKHIEANHFNSAYHTLRRYPEILLTNSDDPETETERVEKRKKSLDWLKGELQFLEGQQQQFYRMIYQVPEGVTDPSTVRYIPRNSSTYELAEQAKAFDEMETKYLLQQEIDDTLRRSKDKKWVRGELIPELTNKQKDNLIVWYDNLFTGLLLATFLDAEEGISFAHVNDGRALPIKRLTYNIPTPDMKIPSERFDGYIDGTNEPRQKTVTRSGFSFIETLRKLATSTLVSIARSLVFIKSMEIGDVYIREGQRVIEVAGSRMSKVYVGAPQPGLWLPNFWDQSKIEPKGLSRETMILFIDLALEQYVEVLGESRRIVEQAERELGATFAR
jgi:hypothetical protein